MKEHKAVYVTGVDYETAGRRFPGRRMETAATDDADGSGERGKNRWGVVRERLIRRKREKKVMRAVTVAVTRRHPSLTRRRSADGADPQNII